MHRHTARAEAREDDGAVVPCALRRGPQPPAAVLPHSSLMLATPDAEFHDSPQDPANKLSWLFKLARCIYSRRTLAICDTDLQDISVSVLVPGTAPKTGIS